MRGCGLKGSVKSDLESMRARRYLLGEASEDECVAIEQEYFGGTDALDRMAASEDDLIEDYLRGQLSSHERRQFERVYLAAPHHRNRVETIRRLMAVASAPAQRTAQGREATWAGLLQTWRWQFALAAVVLVAAVVWVLMASSRQRPTLRPVPPRPASETTAASAPNHPEPGLPAAPRVLAVSIPPVNTRSTQETRPIVIPVATDFVAAQLEGEADRKLRSPARASVRTVAGDEIWQGPALIDQTRPVGVVARIDIPAARLRPDDYLITLYETDAAGTDRERYRYFMRVRAQ
jgi:hypothetical protein